MKGERPMSHKAPKQIIATVWFLVVMLGILYIPQAAWAAGIDSAAKYAWSTNVGWINFNPTVGGAVAVYGDHLEGYIWAENVPIRMLTTPPTTTASTAITVAD
jgi:hypothetical protein